MTSASHTFMGLLSQQFVHYEQNEGKIILMSYIRFKYVPKTKATN